MKSIQAGDFLGVELEMKSSRILPRLPDSVRAQSWQAGERLQVRGLFLSDEAEGVSCWLTRCGGKDFVLAPWPLVARDAGLVTTS
jgi:hypothetical protein